MLVVQKLHIECQVEGWVKVDRLQLALHVSCTNLHIECQVGMGVG